MGKRCLIWVALAMALLLITTPALAKGEQQDGITIWNENYTVTADEVVKGDLVVFNGSAILERNSRVEGSVVVWNGNADVAGTIEGDLVVTNGTIDLGEDAWVRGNMVCTLNCNIERDSGARVDGTVTEGLALPGLSRLPMERFRSAAPFIEEYVPAPGVTNRAGRVMSGFLGVMRSLASILVVSIVAGLVALIWPRQIAQVERTIVEAPGPAFGIGLLTVIAACALVIALLLTICIPPIVLLALSVAGLFGWASLGTLVGERFFKAINAPQSTPMWPAAVGTLIISIASTGLSLLWCIGIIGGIATFVAVCFGLGAVVLTRFGVRRYAPAPRVALPPQPPAPPVDANDEGNAELPFRPNDPEA